MDMDISALKELAANPRIITDESMGRLKASIARDPEFMVLRPIVVDDDGTVLGGNKRLEAIKGLGMTEVPDSWVVKASGLNDEQKQRFILVDNAPEGMSGTWDLDTLAADYDALILEELGFNLEEIEIPEVIFDEDATSSNSGGHGVQSSVSFWIYDHKITDGRDATCEYIEANMERIRAVHPERLADAIVGALHEILD
jgi:hypothetical protein